MKYLVYYRLDVSCGWWHSILTVTGAPTIKLPRVSSVPSIIVNEDEEPPEDGKYVHETPLSNHSMA